MRQIGAYDSWIQDTWVIAFEDGEFIIGLPDAFRRDWLEQKLRTQIKRSLSVIMGRSLVDVHFRVQPRPVVDAPNAHPAPLYDELTDERAMSNLTAKAKTPRAQRRLLLSTRAVLRKRVSSATPS